MRLSQIARANPLPELHKDYSVAPGGVRIQSNPGGDLVMPLHANRGMPAAVRNRLFGGSGRRNPIPDAVIAASTANKPYGLDLNAEQITDILEQILKRNEDLMRSGAMSLPVCIWGSHGLGKTSTVRAIAKKNGWKMAYVAPAQFEDPGDFLGMPIRETVNGKVRTTYAAPDWVPTEEGPGILIIDDFNRASTRLLRSMMQLFQDQTVGSWGLPRNWMIVATANPGEDGKYSVTDLDPAMMTRMMHIEMKFDLGVWARWANSKDAKGRPNVDPRAVKFMTQHAVGGMAGDFSTLYIGNENYPKTTPRTLDLLFSQIANIKNWKANHNLVSAYAYGLLDSVPAEEFMKFADRQEEEKTSVDAMALITAPPSEQPALLQAAADALRDPDGGFNTERTNQFIADLGAAITGPAEQLARRAETARNNPARRNSNLSLRDLQENVLRIFAFPGFSAAMLPLFVSVLVERYPIDGTETKDNVLPAALTLDDGRNEVAIRALRTLYPTSPVWEQLDRMKQGAAATNPRFGRFPRYRGR